MFDAVETVAKSFLYHNFLLYASARSGWMEKAQLALKDLPQNTDDDDDDDDVDTK